MLVVKDILFHRRQYFIEKVKAPLQKAIEKLGSRANSYWVRLLVVFEILRLIRKYPEPTRENTVFNNSHIYIDIANDFKKWHRNPGRQALIDAGLRLLIDTVEHDGYYDFLFSVFISECLRRGWKPEERGFPMWRYWNGPLMDDNFLETVPDWFKIFTKDERVNIIVSSNVNYPPIISKGELQRR